MRARFAAVVAVFTTAAMLASCAQLLGRKTPQQECKAAVATSCKRLQECLDPAAFAKSYADEADCENQLQVASRCATADTTACDSGRWNSAGVTGCEMDVANASCDAIRDGTAFTTASCTQPLCS